MSRRGHRRKEREPSAAREPLSTRAEEVRRRLERGAYSVDLDELADAIQGDLHDDPRCDDR